MRIVDFPSIARSTIGFERMMNLLDQAPNAALGNYPPYNIEKTGEDSYRITFAVAGYKPDELSVAAQGDMLIVGGRRADRNATYLHQGIPSGPFERRFDLADHVKAVGARFHDGLLLIDLVREVPEAMKPKRIAIEVGAPPAALPKAA
ncbi:MAG TPA: Hsp20 family protein [Alphaproteobacteria bacterium]|nr:Hsp20 family protein [Alphaproteobacteria bacterium]